MVREGQIVLFRFPQTDQSRGKLRPALVVRKLPGPYSDWLICMVSSQLGQRTPGLDELVDRSNADFARSGLRTASVIRIARLAVVDEAILLGPIGEINVARLDRAKRRLADWLTGT